MIDLRSDTVSQPTPEMRRAMYEAEVGDDGFGDDPTVILLERRAAELLGKEAGLFVPSGTMGNLVSQMAHVPRGGEIIAAAESHLVWRETSGHAVAVGASIQTVPVRSDGTMDPKLVDASFRSPGDLHAPLSSLVVLENTHSGSMGQPLTASYTAKIAALAHRHRVPLHVDGARFFNAVVALNTTAAALAEPADSLAFCLSKGLACPVGSMVVGSRDFVDRARRARALLGGGLRQVGVLAAPGLVALRDGPSGMIDRLSDDHANARRLADALAGMPGIVGLDPTCVRTNFVVFRVVAAGRGAAAKRDPSELRARFLDALRERGFLLNEYHHNQVRAVTHYGIDEAHIDRLVVTCRDALTACGAAPASR